MLLLVPEFFCGLLYTYCVFRISSCDAKAYSALSPNFSQSFLGEYFTNLVSFRLRVRLSQDTRFMIECIEGIFS